MKRTYLTLIILMLVIGFATVATNLVINGKINIGFNKKDFNDGVVFSYAHTDTGTAEIDKETEKTLTFETITLVNKGEESILDYDIANKSEQYDANVTLNCILKEEEYKQYVTFKNTMKDSFKLEAGKTESGTITVTLAKPATSDIDINLVCEINATAQSREDRQEYIPKIHAYKEILLHGADPVIEGTGATTTGKKLIPVKIGNDGKVTKADIEKQWYDYEHQEWANAVILNTGVKEPEVGGEIKETDIESYFVWIPKYRYKLWNVDNSNNGGPREIEIEFNLEDTEDNESNPEYKECKTPLNTEGTQALSGQKGKCNNGEWMTHPAFITMGVNGFWAGKFEVGYRGAATTEEAQKDENDSTKVIVKPNVYSWRNINDKNIFNSLKGYASNLDSHMMKNTEWGAVAYLSHSKYGINYEVAPNINSQFITSYAKINDSSMDSYPNQSGFIASTTGNITGIYDMSGGAWDRVAAYREVVNENEQIGKSGFTKQEIQKIGEKYFDVYNGSSTVTSYEYRILGDSTGEMGPFSVINNYYIGSWYQDYAYFAESANPWFSRGGTYSDGSGGAGQFDFAWSCGETDVYNGFRLVLSPQ